MLYEDQVQMNKFKDDLSKIIYKYVDVLDANSKDMDIHADNTTKLASYIENKASANKIGLALAEYDKSAGILSRYITKFEDLEFMFSSFLNNANNYMNKHPEVALELKAVIRDADDYLDQAKIYKHEALDMQKKFKEFSAKVRNNLPQNQENNKKGCYVATCVYGSYDCPEVWTLRRFRDYTLSKSFLGRTFIQFYYATSPTLVSIFGNSNLFKSFCKVPLDLLVKRLYKKGVKNTPYNDLSY